MNKGHGMALGALVALGVWSVGAVAEEALETGALLGPDAAVSDRELAGTSGLGVIAIDDTNIIDSDSSLIVMGERNSAAKADATGTINGQVTADTVNAGQVSNLSAQQLSGFNVIQVNTAPNANQIVSQAINVYIIDSGVAAQ